MPVTSWTDGRIYIGGINLSSHANQGSLELTAAELDASSVSDAWDVYVMGRKRARLEASGFWEAGDALPDELFDRLGSARIAMMVLPDGDEGSVGYAVRAVPVSYSAGGTSGELMGFNVSAAGDIYRAIRGTVVLDDTAAVTSTSDGTAFQLGAVTSGQTLYAAIHVVAASGTTPTFDVIVESDNAEAMTTPTTRLTFSQFTDTGAEWQLSTSTVTDTWWRVGMTVGGTGSPSFTAAVLIAIH